MMQHMIVVLENLLFLRKHHVCHILCCSFKYTYTHIHKLTSKKQLYGNVLKPKMQYTWIMEKHNTFTGLYSERNFIQGTCWDQGGTIEIDWRYGASVSDAGHLLWQEDIAN